MKPWQPLVMALAVVLAAGCSSEDPTKLVASAQAFLDKNDRESAVIQLKTALQADPSLAQARFLLGRTLLDQGDAAAALIELDKALELKHPEAAVVPVLAQAYNRAGQHDKLVERFGQTTLGEPPAQADLQAALAVAHGALGRREPALQAVQAALSAQPEHVAAGVFRARLLADAGDIDGALAAADAVLARQPASHEALLAKADFLAFGKRDMPAALAAYEAAADARPDFVPAHVGALRLLIAERDLERAKARLDKLKKAQPRSPQSLYYEGSLALLGREFDKAREIADQLLHLSPDNPRVLQLAGAVAYERNDLAQAEQHLSQAVRVTPREPVPRRLLAQTHLRQGQAAKALAVLQPLLDGGDVEAITHSLLAQAHMQSGDLASAETHFAKASSMNPEDTRNRAALAVSRLAQGESGALAELASIAAADTGTAADLPLISAYVRQKEYGKAVKALDALETKLGGPQAYTWNLRGLLQLRMGDPAAARTSLGKALALRPAFFPAAATLARMDLAEKRPEDARKRFEAVLAAEPGHAQALVALATMKARAGAPREDVMASLREAMRQQPGSVPVRSAVVNYHLGLNETADALEAARQGVAAAPQDPDMQALLGRALLAARQANQAVTAFNKLVQMQPQSATALLRLAEAQMASDARAEAIPTLRRALTIEPGHLAVQRALVGALQGEGLRDEAMQVAKDMQRRHPAQEIGYAAEGAVHAAAKRWPEAITAYRAGLKVQPDSAMLATRLHAALMASGQTAAADSWTAQWRKAHPQDAVYLFYLGDQAMMRKDLAAAESHYRDVMKLQPENALAINNVAWLMAEARKPGALEMALRADKLLVNRPVIMDTVAYAHSRAGQPGKAAEVLRQALAIEPDNASLRLNLAKALADSGNKSAAKEQLKEVLKLGSSFARIEEARELMRTL